MTYDEEVNKMVDYVENKFVKLYPTLEEINFCKSVHYQRTKNRNIYNNNRPKEFIQNGRISPNHDDDDLWWGLQCELTFTKLYSQSLYANEPIRLMKQWAEDQKRQNEQLLKFGFYDCKDVGGTQIRGFEYVKHSKRNIIYREKDFRSKLGQPLVGCVCNTKENDIWVEICGFITYEDLIKRKSEFWKNPKGLGWGMFIPIWELTPMNKFNLDWLKE